MGYFKLPPSTEINRSIPKNAFDKFTNAKQKKLLVEAVDKIKWTNKIAPETINLTGTEITEIQVFEIQLKTKNNVREILDVIDKSIPYHIVFILHFQQNILISTTKKHPHITKEDLAVLDWNFSTEWLDMSSATIQFILQSSIDTVYANLCFQIKGCDDKKITIQDFIEKDAAIKNISYQIEKLKSAIKNCKQFNRRVELNLQLNSKVTELNGLQH
ncbi:MAG: DUF4391 domain-containing protein [Flavobacterium sp.]|nr:DUF4391 domain-containing protein [Flavobacterium sp.]